MYLLRDVNQGDLERLVDLASALDTLNLPHDKTALEKLIDLSKRSFSGELENPLERVYLFVLEDLASGTLVGTSQIIAQHGTREAPHVYLDLYEREHYSAVLDKHFRHLVMRIGYNYEGFTEIGGLVVNPRWRGKGKPGKQLSFVRFLFVAMNRELFRDRIIAELLPPLQPDGKSILWEAFGARFTGIDYREADRLSRESKEFIQQLFPQGEIYVELLPQEVQQVIGQVGPATEPVRRMLESVGFTYDNRIDPFDGGPHYSAHTDDIVPIQEYRAATVAEKELTDDGKVRASGTGPRNSTPAPDESPTNADTAWEHRLVGVERPEEGRRFRAVLSVCRFENGMVLLPRSTRQALGVTTGERVHTIPFEV